MKENVASLQLEAKKQLAQKTDLVDRRQLEAKKQLAQKFNLTDRSRPGVTT